MRAGATIAGVALSAAIAIAAGLWFLREDVSSGLVPEATAVSSAPHAHAQGTQDEQDEASATAPAPPRVVLTEPEPELLHDFTPEQREAVREILALYRPDRLGEPERFPAIFRDSLGYPPSAALVVAEVVKLSSTGVFSSPRVTLRYRSSAPHLGIEAGESETMLIIDHANVHEIKERHGLLGGPELQQGAVQTVVIVAAIKRCCPLAGPPHASSR